MVLEVNIFGWDQLNVLLILAGLTHASGVQQLGPLGLAAPLASSGMNGPPGSLSTWSLSLHWAGLGLFTEWLKGFKGSQRVSSSV